MCGRFAMANKVNELITEFVAAGGDPSDWVGDFHASWNVKPTQEIPVLFEAAKGDDAVRRRAELARWSLVPSWSKELKLKFPTFNARSEGITEKATWKAPVKSKRAIIPASGYYEWRTVGKTKTPYFIHTPGELLYFAGLYSWWRAPGSTADDDWILTATILTRGAVGEVASLHERTPVTLPASWADDWIDATVVGDQSLVDAAVAAATPVAEGLEFYEVAPLTGDGPELVRPL